MCTPDVGAKRPPLQPKSPAPPSAVQACPLTATVRVRAADGTSEPCPLVAVGNQIKLRAVGSRKGTSAWSTKSTKVFLADDRSETVTVVAGDQPSESRGAEVLELVFTPDGQEPLAPLTVGVSVVRGVFRKATDTAYGFDDMVPVGEPDDPHASVKRNASTRLLLELQGGAALGDLKFVSSDGATATAAADPAGPAGTVLVSAGAVGHATIHAVCACDATQELARVHADVYKESVYTLKVARMWDSRSPKTRLDRPLVDIEGTEEAVQATYKDGVLRARVVDLGNGKPFDVPFDDPRSGSLLFIPPDGGPQFSVVKGALGASSKTAVNIVVVRDMRYFFPLARDAKAHERTVEIWHVVGGWMDHVFLNKSYTLSTGHGIPGAPTYKVVSVDGFVATLDRPLDEDHAAGEGLSRTFHGINSDPIFLIEEHDDPAKGELATELEAATMAHEALHSLGGILDIIDAGNIMNFEHSPGRRLWFHDLPFRYPKDPPPGVTAQRQWDDLKRP